MRDSEDRAHDGFFDCLKNDSAHLLYNKCAEIGETI